MALSEKKKASNSRWDKDHLKRMSLAMRTDLYERMQQHITETGESANGFINRAIEEALKAKGREGAARYDPEGG